MMFRLVLDHSGAQRLLGQLSGRLRETGPLLTAIAADMERAVRQNFAQGGRPQPWPESHRARTEGGRTLQDTLLLLSSIYRRSTGRAATVFTRDKRARLLHFGGTVRPRQAKALTIPLTAAARGRRARDFADTFILRRENKPPLIMQRGNAGSPPTALYVLLPAVRIPARPFLTVPESDIEQIIIPRISRHVVPR